MSVTQIHEPHPEQVAAYDSPDAASKAATHLVELGFDERAIGIAPRDFHLERERPFLRRMAGGMRWGAIGGATVAAVVGLASLAGLAEAVRTMVPGVLVGAALGLLAGVLLAILVGMYEVRRSFGSTNAYLVPARYEVVVGEDRERANNALARWWDPSAPPVGVRRSA